MHHDLEEEEDAAEFVRRWKLPGSVPAVGVVEGIGQ